VSSHRRRALLAIAAGCLCLGVVYVIVASFGAGSPTSDATPRAVAATGPVPASADLLVRGVDRDDPRLNGHVFRVEDGKPLPSATSDLACQRVHFAAGRGLCLAVASSGVDYEAIVFDAQLHRRARFGLTGLPSRARVSPDGRYGAVTVFVNGHSYLGEGGFSTTTTIVDMRSGEQLGELEEFDVFMGEGRIESPDFNFWGVTFADDPNRFYATLRTGDSYYLVEGDLDTRRMRALRDGVECPSLSPDGTRIAYKSRLGNSDQWRLRVLDLATLSDHSVAEQRSIDDQVEWLDDRTLAYSDGLDVYTTPADGSGEPRRLLRGAASPAALSPR
jgi:WD40-like Beta Propeller Repeat